MKVLLYKIFFTTFLCIAILCSCDAPRQNPLDPLNSNNKLSVLSGTVFTKSVPLSPIANAEVFWQPAGRIVKTDANGQFSFDDLTPAEGLLIVSKTGFTSNSVQIIISEKEQKTKEFYLNSEPILLAANMSSEVLNRYPSAQSTTLDIMISVNDADNDIDSVFISNETLGIHKILNYNAGTRQYEKNFTPYLLGLRNMEQLVGQEFEIIIKDLAGVVYSIGSTYLKRIIHQDIQFNTPANSQTLSGTVNLTWDLFDPGFDFTYIVEIFIDEFFYQELVWEKSDISSRTNSIIVEPDLPAGNYFWVIWCVDEYGNRSRSKPATFTVSGN